jgi:hypothetical protein
MLSRMPEVGATFVAAGALWQCGAGSAEGRRRYYVGLGWPLFSRPNWEFSLQEGAPPGCRRSMSGTDDTVSKPDKALAVMWTASVFSVDLGASAVCVANWHGCCSPTVLLRSVGENIFLSLPGGSEETCSGYCCSRNRSGIK